MSGKKIGDPCPKCASTLLRRRRATVFRGGDGDIAYCAPCNAAWDIAVDDPLGVAAGFAPGLAAAR